MFTKIVKDEVYRGYRVLVKRFGFKPSSTLPFSCWYCGYVEIPKGGIFYGVDDFDELNCELNNFHINYADDLPETGNFVLGFDCNDFGDSSRVQNVEFALKECYYIVDQIIEKEKEWSPHTEIEELKLLKEKEDKERLERIPYWKQIIEDLTGCGILFLLYDTKKEVLKVLWADAYRAQLVIDIHMDSLRACTHDVIRQTYDWIASEILKETP